MHADPAGHPAPPLLRPRRLPQPHARHRELHLGTRSMGDSYNKTHWHWTDLGPAAPWLLLRPQPRPRSPAHRLRPLYGRQRHAQPAPVRRGPGLAPALAGPGEVRRSADEVARSRRTHLAPLRRPVELAALFARSRLRFCFLRSPLRRSEAVLVSEAAQLCSVLKEFDLLGRPATAGGCCRRTGGALEGTWRTQC